MEQTPLTQEPQPEAPPPPAMSLGGRLLNVFATPGDVFQEVKTAKPSAANWLVPALILIAVSWVAAWLIFSQDSIKHQLSEITDQAIQKQVERTHMSEQQAEQARAVGEKWAGISAKVAAVLAPGVRWVCHAVLLGADHLAGGRQGVEGELSLYEGGGGRRPGEHDQRAWRSS